MHQGSGPLDAKLWVVGTFPSAQDLENNEVFSEKAGQLVKKYIRKSGVVDIRYEYLIGDRPPNNRFAYFEEDGQQREVLLDSVGSLLGRVRESCPNVILLLGEKPLYHFTNKRGVSKWRGHILLDKEQTKLIATHHPETAIKQKFWAEDMFPGQYEALLMTDVQKACKESESPETNFPEVEVHTGLGYRDTVQFLEELIADAEIISFDIETWGGCLIDCISFASKLTEGICVPFYNSMSNEHWNRDEFHTIFNLIKELLESNIPKVAQNAQYDITILEYYYKIRVRNLVWDTMVAAHNLYCDFPKDLGTLISLYTSLPYHKYLKDTGSRWEYNGLDSISTLHVMRGEEKELEELGLLDHYKTITSPILRPLVDMQLAGVNVDIEFKNKAVEECELKMAYIMKLLDTALPNKINTSKTYTHKFNPNSPKDKKFLFYDVFKCRKVYHQGTLTTKSSALKEFIRKAKNDYIVFFAELCLGHKEASYLASRLKTELLDGRMHTQYDSSGTVTGRLNSKESILEGGKGTNLQNAQEGPQRRMMIPDEGEEFANVDLYAAEAYIVAAEAREYKMLEMLDAGAKIHTWIQEETKERYPEETKNYVYKKAKQTIHALNYGVEIPMMSMESGLSPEICQWQNTYYHSTFPGIKIRQKLLKEKLKERRMVESVLGRRRYFFAPYNHNLLNKAYAWPSQSFIGELTNIALRTLWSESMRHLVDDEHIWCLPCMNNHDGIVNRIKLGTREKVTGLIKRAFNIPVTVHDRTFTVPIDVSFGPNFNEIYEESKVIRYGQ